MKCSLGSAISGGGSVAKALDEGFDGAAWSTRRVTPLLVFTTAIWGVTFLIVKDEVASMPAMQFLALRFSLATLLLGILWPRAVLAIRRRTLFRGAALGASLSVGMVLQTLGLQHTSAAISGFLTGLQVVFVPLLAWLMLHQRSSLRTVTSVVVATGGLAWMTFGGISFGIGATLTLFGALSFGMQIIGLGAWSAEENMYALTFVQIAIVALVGWLGAIPAGLDLSISMNGWLGILATGAFATAFALVLQTWAQALISPTKAGIIYTLEPAFAALFAFLGGERVAISTLEGGSLVLVAMVLVESGPQKEVVAPTHSGE